MPERLAPDSPTALQLNQLHQLDRDIRGHVFHQATTIEGLIQDILAKHFCAEEDRQHSLYSYVLQELRFQRKIDIFWAVISEHYPSASSTHPSLKTDLSAIIKERNMAAHWSLDTSDAFLARGVDERVVWTSWQKGKVASREIAVADVQAFLQTCSRALFALIEIQTAVASARG